MSYPNVPKWFYVGDMYWCVWDRKNKRIVRTKNPAEILYGHTIE